MLSFREMTEKDLACVTQLEFEASEHPWKTSHFKDSLSKSNYVCTIASLNEEDIGHGVLMNAADEAHLLILTVKKTHQGKGFGKQLLRYLIQRAQHEANTLLLEVRDSNLSAFNLYLNEGLCEVGRRRNYYPATDHHPSEDAIVMALDLNAIDQ